MAREFQLEEYGMDLTAQARLGQLDPVVGRHAEIERMAMILVRKTKNNPVLLGEPGVGKTAIAEGLAQRIVAEQVPFQLCGKTIFSLNLGQLLAGTGYRGDFEKRLQDLVRELLRPGTSRILFIDEIHLLGRAGKSEGGLDAANLLKPLLARGTLPCIGASTVEEWRQMVQTDKALERRFQPIEVREPTPEETFEILKGLRSRYEDHHNIEISDGALLAAVKISTEQMSDRHFPDKAVDLLDEACARMRLRQGVPPAVRPKENEELERAEERYDFEAVARLRRKWKPETVAQRLLLEAADVGTHFQQSP